MKMTTETKFRQDVLEKQGLSVVKFFADWSGTSQMMMPAFEQLADYYKPNASFFKVDIDSNPLLKETYGVMDLPTILFFKNGEIIDHVSGMTSRNALIAKMENSLNSNN
jgi:thioredoxin 1